jgi:hypothetical protein
VQSSAIFTYLLLYDACTEDGTDEYGKNFVGVPSNGGNSSGARFETRKENGEKEEISLNQTKKSELREPCSLV